MRRVHLTRAGAAGALGALALSAVLTACGSEEPEAADDPAAVASSSAPADEPSDSIATETPAVIEDGGQIAPEVFLEKLRNGVENTQYAHVKYVSGNAEGEGDVDFTVRPPNMQLSRKVGGKEQNVLLVDAVMYFESPMARGEFITFDLNDPNNPLASDFVDSMDPAAAFTTFMDAVTSVVSQGEEEVAGQTLDRYEITIDTSKVPAEPSPGMPAEGRASAWMDDQDRMVKMRIELGQNTYVSVLSGINKPFELQAPPADQIVNPPTA